jgi:hypothetical protein
MCGQEFCNNVLKQASYFSSRDFAMGIMAFFMSCIKRLIFLAGFGLSRLSLLRIYLRGANAAGTRYLQETVM